jgi:hypothetical protein
MKALWVAITLGLVIGGVAYWKSDVVNSTWDTMVTKVNDTSTKAEEATPAPAAEIVPLPTKKDDAEASAPTPNEEADPVPADVTPVPLVGDAPPAAKSTDAPQN